VQDPARLVAKNECRTCGRCEKRKREPEYQIGLSSDFVPSQSEVKKPHPSEDGEAMAEIQPLQSPLPAPVEVPGDPTMKQWFAVYTTCRHEKRVAAHLEHRAIEHYLPLYRSQRRWRDGSRVVLSLPLFPGYVFVRIGRDQRVPVLEVPGVLWVVGRSGSQPTPLPEFEVETLRASLDPLRVEPYPLLATGQRVRIRAGALAGIEGIVVRRKNSLRIVITLELIMQSIAVEVNADDLEPIDSNSSGLPGSQAANPKQQMGPPLGRF
jgi:transcription antitermination factor NusG